jgi:glycine/D-amino acid oxidase-like deaminating enzyme
MAPRPIPFWLDCEREVSFATLQTNLKVDVAIVGAGIVGLHAAYLLRDSGLKIAVLEAREVGRQATGRSTAKVTSQHGLKYASLTRDFGKESAKLYADANEKAKDDIAALCSVMPESANLEPKAAFIYSEDGRNSWPMRSAQ